jgi:creatinine amidohydrolase/Fe(II)-dependent formamide hydrolase-like protein
MLMKHFLRAACGALLLCSAAQAEPRVEPSIASPPAAAPAYDDDPRSMGGGRCRDNVYNCADTPNPLPATKTVWIDAMTWMDVRDALAAGKKTVIIPSGGIEPNGVWTALGKHDWIAHGLGGSIAHRLGNALCAPVVEFVPEGEPGQKHSHADTVGTIGVSDATYAALVSDIARGMKVHGFENIILVGDHGGGQKIMADVADRLNKEWGGTHAIYIKAFYDSWDGADALLQKDMKLWQPGVRDGMHDDPDVELQLILQDPETIRWRERVKAHKAVINGVSVADLSQARAWGRRIVEYRTTVTVAAISQAIAARSH